MKYLWFVNFKYVFKKKIKLRKNSSFNWFTPFHVLIRPDVIWKNLSRPLYHVHFTVIHTNSRHNSYILQGHFTCVEAMVIVFPHCPNRATLEYDDVIKWKHFLRYWPFTGGNRTKLPSSRWRRRGRSLREVFACSCFFATTDLSQIYNRETRRHGTPCTKSTNSYLFSFLYNNPRKIRRETTVGKFVPNNGRR